MNKKERDKKINWIFDAVYNLLCYSEYTLGRAELLRNADKIKRGE